MKNFPWIDKKISSIDLNNLSHALIVEGQEGVGKNQICQFLINGLLRFLLTQDFSYFHYR